MAFDLSPFQSIPLDEPLLRWLLDRHSSTRLPRFARLWSYYRNALAEPDRRGGSSGYPAQIVGLPQRLRGPARTINDDRIGREIVIENDIAWRIHALVDIMFPATPQIKSTAQTPDVASEIETILGAIFDVAGGTGLWQNAALLGAVYGHVDFLLQTNLLRANSSFFSQRSPGDAPSKPIAIRDLASAVAHHFLIETVEAPRAIALLSPADYRKLDAFIVTYRRPSNAVSRESWLARAGRAVLGSNLQAAHSSDRREHVTVIEIYTATHMQRYEDERLVHESPNRLGRLPVVHVQNLSQPLTYEGLSDVEPLIPLQDELNTRLSDRANRVTMQSFRMWLGKGVDGFTDQPIGPGQMWMTDNLEASIEAFGGDADSPSERQHIEELREALDKASGVTPAAAGHIKAKVGNLTSENALRISLLGTLAKVKRKRVTYSAAIEQLCELILHGLHVHGVYRTSPRDRTVEVIWPDPLPADQTRRINDALAKAELGVPRETVLAELGYGSPDGPK